VGGFRRAHTHTHTHICGVQKSIILILILHWTHTRKDARTRLGVCVHAAFVSFGVWTHMRAAHKIHTRADRWECRAPFHTLSLSLHFLTLPAAAAAFYHARVYWWVDRCASVGTECTHYHTNPHARVISIVIRAHTHLLVCVSHDPVRCVCVCVCLRRAGARWRGSRWRRGTRQNILLADTRHSPGALDISYRSHGFGLVDHILSSSCR